MIVQIIGHGEFKTPVSDDHFTIRIRDWGWQMELEGYGTRTDVTVWNEVWKPPGYIQSEIWVTRPHMAGKGKRDISGMIQNCASTGQSAANAARKILDPEVIRLFGFTAAYSGQNEKRLAPGDKITAGYRWGEQREQLESIGVEWVW